MGISVRRFYGWEPGEVTTFEWDDDGRLIRAVTVRESEFSDWDRALLLADHREAHTVRGRHGVPMVDALDTANQFAFEVPPPSVDWAQQKLNQAQERYKTAYPNADMDSLHWEVRKSSSETRSSL